MVEHRLIVCGLSSLFKYYRAYFHLDVCPSGQRREAQDLPLSAAWVRIPSHLLIAMLAERYKALASKARASLMSEVRILHMAFSVAPYTSAAPHPRTGRIMRCQGSSHSVTVYYKSYFFHILYHVII